MFEFKFAAFNARTGTRLPMQGIFYGSNHDDARTKAWRFFSEQPMARRLRYGVMVLEVA